MLLHMVVVAPFVYVIVIILVSEKMKDVQIDNNGTSATRILTAPTGMSNKENIVTGLIV